MHDATGAFVSSMVVGQKFMRFTNDTATISIPLTSAYFSHGKRWVRISNGVRFKPKKFKSGRWGILVVTPESHRVLFHVDEAGTIYVRDGHGNVLKQSLGFDPIRVLSSKTVPNPEALAAFESFVDSHGSWRGDEDFLGKESSIQGSGDVKMARTRKKKRSAGRAAMASRSAMFVNPNPTGDGDFGDLADFADIGADAQSFGDLISGDFADFGDSGDCDAEIAAATANGLPFNTIVGKASMRCAGLAALVLGAAANTGGNYVAFALACIGTKGGPSCTGATLRSIGATTGIAAAWAAYVLNDCPREGFDCTS